MKAKKTTYLQLIIFWLPVLFFSGLLIFNATGYFTFDKSYGILPEKGALVQSRFYLFTFYIHVLSGIVCLLIPPFSFIGARLKKSINFHKIIGNIYTWNMLMILAPSGIYMGFYAKGGVASQSGFILHGILSFIFTWYGYKTASINIAEHRNWMIRSFASASSVITFRIFHIAFMFVHLPYEDIYSISQWLSLAVHLFLAESIILLKDQKKIISSRSRKMNTIATRATL